MQVSSTQGIDGCSGSIHLQVQFPVKIGQLMDLTSWGGSSLGDSGRSLSFWACSNEQLIVLTSWAGSSLGDSGRSLSFWARSNDFVCVAADTYTPVLEKATARAHSSKS